jgi:uncharacterized protein
MTTPRIPIPTDRIADFCRRWKVTEFAIFGSVLRDDFGPESDVDVLLTFDDQAHPTLFDLVAMQDELSKLLGRPVDLSERGSIEASRNEVRRRSILGSAEVLYAA